MIKITLIIAAVLFSGCANTDPTLADHVIRMDNGQYQTFPYANINPYNEAVAQCKLDGNKKVKIITNYQQYDYVSKRDVPVSVFECIDK